MGKLCDCRHVMADKEDGSSLTLGDVIHLSEALLLKFSVPNGEHLIYKKYLRLEMGCDSKRETYVHSGRIPFHRSIYKFLDLGKRYNFIEFLANLSASHTENRSIRKNILAPGQLRMEAGTDFKEARHPAT